MKSPYNSRAAEWRRRKHDQLSPGAESEPGSTTAPKKISERERKATLKKLKADFARLQAEVNRLEKDRK